MLIRILLIYNLFAESANVDYLGCMVDFSGYCRG